MQEIFNRKQADNCTRALNVLRKTISCSYNTYMLSVKIDLVSIPYINR